MVTRKRMASLQTKLVRFNVAVTRSYDRTHFIFSLRHLPDAILSPVCPMIRAGLEQFEIAERNPSSIQAKLYELLHEEESVEWTAF